MCVIFPVFQPTLQEATPSDDLAKLPEIKEDILVAELHKRYMDDRIYVSTGTRPTNDISI